VHPGLAGALRFLLSAVLLLAAGTAGGEVPQPSSEDGPSASASVTATLTVASLGIEEVGLPLAPPSAGSEVVVRVRVRNDRLRAVTASSVTVTAGTAAPVTVAGPPIPAAGAAVVEVRIRPCASGALPLRVAATAVDGTGSRSSPVREAVLAVATGPGCTDGAAGAAGVIVVPSPASQTGLPTTSAVLETPGGPVELAVSAGRLADLAAVPLAGLPEPPAGWTFPYGAFSFAVEDVAVGGTVELQVAAPGVAASGPLGGYAKSTSSGWVLLPPVAATADAIVVQLTDGGTGDADGRADGRIVDPAAPAVRAPEAGTGTPSGAEPPQAEVLGAVEERALAAAGDGGSLRATAVVLLLALAVGTAGLAVLRLRRRPTAG
jgi:hypothetical protein